MNRRTLHDILVRHATLSRFVAILLLLGAGETLATIGLAHFENDHAWARVAHVLGMVVWNLAILIVFFHLPCMRELRSRQKIQNGLVETQQKMRNVTDPEELGEIILRCLADNMSADSGLLYLAGTDGKLHLTASYGILPDRAPSRTLQPGEGVLGEIAVHRKLTWLSNTPIDSLRMQAELMEVVPNHLLAVPLLHEDQVKGVLALGAVRPFEKWHAGFLERIGDSIARAFSGVQTGLANRKLLDQTRRQAETLAINQQVLRGTIEQLEKESGYKSRFLANMSHELRSPLNSLLILARLLGENKPGNLTDKQVEFASTIHAAGSDLLTLIDEILDLARIEAGRIRIFNTPIRLTDLASNLERLFTHVAREKGLEFRILFEEPLPHAIHTDRMRVEQILKNLISNAIKFTPAGQVTVILRTRRPEGNGEWLTIAVEDTGIGIPGDQQTAVFEPFKQLDDGLNRKYGGTGLGLTICQELSHLLNGRVELVSTVGHGSVFTLWLPMRETEAPPSPETNEIDGMRDDRRTLRPDDHAILVVGREFDRMRHISELAGARDLRVIVAGDRGAALFLAHHFQPLAIVISGELPDQDTNNLLLHLRKAVRRPRCPILYLTTRADLAAGLALPEEAQVIPPTLGQGALSLECGRFLAAIAEAAPDLAPNATPAPQPLPAAPEHTLAGKRILLVDDDIRNVFAMTNLLEEKGGEVIMAENGHVALERLQAEAPVDLVLLDVMLPDRNGYAVLDEIRRRPAWRDLPILVLTSRALPGERLRCLEAGASDYLSKPVDTNKLLSMMHLWLNMRTIAP
ncbi:MAG: response regulator [Magnetococcales bacterium]|nr:response regulator [Magnetococcales bacterium]